MTNKITAEDFWAVLSEPLDPPRPVFYRLYYNDDGSPRCYSMENLSGNFIEIDKDTFAAGSFNVRVVNQKLINLPTASVVSKLKPNTLTGTPCHQQDVCVIVENTMPHVKWSWQ